MKRLEIVFTSNVINGSGLVINASDKEVALIGAAEESTEPNTFYGGSTSTETAFNFAAALRSNNAYNGSLGAIVVDVDTSTVTVTFIDTLITTVTITTIGTSASTETVSDVDNSIYDYDKRIMARSPHFYSVEPDGLYGTTLDSAELHIYAYQGARYTDRPYTPTYVIRSVANVADQTEITFNISEFARSFFGKSLSLSGTEDNWSPFIDIFPFYTKSGQLYSNEPEFGVAYNGYGYFEDGVNPQNQQALAQSNNHLINLDGGGLGFPVFTDTASKIVWEKDGETIKVENITNTANFSTNPIKTNVVGESSLNLKDRANDFNTEYFYNSGAEEFMNQNSITNADKIYIEKLDGSIETLKVSYIKECKYNPVKLTFTNKFGALQSLWFFKNSTESLKTEEKSFRRNTLDQYGQYKTSDHQYKNLYKSGKQSITLNSGFYPESHNEIFKQLMLSQDVWLKRDGEVLSVNISDSTMDFKTSINEKLIEYTVKCDFAFDTINSIN